MQKNISKFIFFGFKENKALTFCETRAKQTIHMKCPYCL